VADFTTEEAGEVFILRFLPHEGPIGIDLEKMQRLLDRIQRVQVPFKALVLVVPTGMLSSTNFETLWPQTLPDSAAEWAEDRLGSLWELAVAREHNAILRFIRLVRNIDTLVLVVLEGEVLFPFLGSALACDYRIVADNTVFINECLHRGVPPCGALPWFLSRHVGHGKATEILFEHETLTADEAHALGLVNRVVPVNGLEGAAMAYAEKIAAMPAVGLAAMKRMLCAAQWSLGSYLEAEAKALEWCVNRRRSAGHRQA
jgi:enoyl-CoA hydratase/carnithine racemase